MTETFSPISWLIVGLPVLSFLLIGLAIIVSGKTQRVARGVSPWVLIVCLLAALVISVGALRETRGRAEHAEDTRADMHTGGSFNHETEALPFSTWYQTSVDWMVPEAPTEQPETSAAIPAPPVNRALKVGVLLDPLAATMLVVVVLVSLLVQIYSFGYMKREEHPRFYLFMSLFTASMLGLVIAGSLLMLFIFWELVGLCSYLLIGFWYQKPEAARAAIKAFVVTRFGDLGLLFAVILLWLKYGDLSFAHLNQAIGGHGMSVETGFLTLIAILIFFGACGKSAQFPLHIWLPDAMEGPTSVSALIHAATMVAAGIYLVARTFFIFEMAPIALLVVALIGAFTALFAATIALAQVDMKKVMAYSTISQLGYMMMGLGLAAPAAAFFHLTTHAFFKAMLFLTAGSVIHAVHTQNIWEMGGLFKKMKVTAITCLIGGLALAGIFPLAGFFSKDKLMEAGLAAALGVNSTLAGAISPAVGWLILVMALVTVLMTAFYTTRMWALVFLGKPRSHEAEHAHESPPSMTFSLIVLAAITLVAGFLVVPHLTGMIAPEHEGLQQTQIAMITFTSLLLALIGVGWGYRVYGKAPTQEPLRKLGFVYAGMVNLWWVNAFFVFLAGHVVLALGSFIRWFDKTVIDGGLVDGTAWITGRIGHTFRRVGAGPLPGQLQYYAFVIFLIAVLVILGMSFFGSSGFSMGVFGR